jgi:ABC-type nitrate/sulfonate/bicarbonate transport system substrate-binding protein
LFQKRGVYPKIKIFHGGPELMQAVREGHVHIGEIGLPPFIKAFSKGLHARIIVSTFIQQLDHYIAARPDIRALSELKGKKIGILSHGSCDEYFIQKLLKSINIDPEFA